MLNVKVDIKQEIMEYLYGCTIWINRYDGNNSEMVIQDEDGRTLIKRIYINDHRSKEDGEE